MPQRFEQGLYHISEDLIWLLLKLELWLLWWFTFARQEVKFEGTPDINTRCQDSVQIANRTDKVGDGKEGSNEDL